MTPLEILVFIPVGFVGAGIAAVVLYELWKG